MREKRLRAWSRLSLNAVALSQLAGGLRAQTASVFKAKRVEVIGNPVDPKLYKPLDKQNLGDLSTCHWTSN